MVDINISTLSTEISMSMKTQCSDKCKKVEVESLEIRHPKFGVTTVNFSSDRNWNITSATQSKKSFKIIKKKVKVVIKGTYRSYCMIVFYDLDHTLDCDL